MYSKKKICTSTESASAQLERLRKAPDTADAVIIYPYGRRGRAVPQPDDAAAPGRMSAAQGSSLYRDSRRIPRPYILYYIDTDKYCIKQKIQGKIHSSGAGQTCRAPRYGEGQRLFGPAVLLRFYAARPQPPGNSPLPFSGPLCYTVFCLAIYYPKGVYLL